MTSPPPPERSSLYPEPHRAGDWSPAPPRRRPRWWIGVIVLAGVGLLALVGWSGLELGRAIGTADVEVADPDGETINAIQAGPGTCLASLPDTGAVGRVEASPCATVHRAEVVASYSYAGDAWPGRDQAVDAILEYCGSFVQPGFGDDAMFQPGDWNAGLRWVAWAPTEDAWNSGERSGVCVVYREDGLRGSFLDRSAVFVG